MQAVPYLWRELAGGLDASKGLTGTMGPGSQKVGMFRHIHQNRYGRAGVGKCGDAALCRAKRKLVVSECEFPLQHEVLQYGIGIRHAARQKHLSPLVDARDTPSWTREWIGWIGGEEAGLGNKGEWPKGGLERDYHPQ
jgi:hypothetical protein